MSRHETCPDVCLAEGYGQSEDRAALGFFVLSGSSEIILGNIDMNHMGKIAAGIALAVGMAFAGSAAGVASAGSTAGTPAKGAQRSGGEVKFFLADPELGLAGVYTVNGVELYFEGRRSVDARTGAPGELSLRVVDGEARTLALAGEPYAKHWVPQQGEFTKKDGFAYAQQLSGLGRALRAADLHASLSAERSALADLVIQAAGTPAGSFPLRTTVPARKSVAPDVSQVADFYQRSVKDIQVDRRQDGTMEAKLGNGIVLLSTQQFIADEPDTTTGQMGRIDAYSLVKAADGSVLTAELGGDQVPEDWADAMEMDTARDHHALAADFGRAATALNALAYSGKSSQGVSLSHRSEQESMQRMAQALVSHFLPVREEASAPALSGGYDTLATVSSTGGLYQTYIQVWRKPFVVIAEHSGTRVGKWKYSSSTSSIRTHQGWIYYCNHGTCAASENMTHKCTFTGPRLSYYRLPARRTDAYGHTCSTGYWAVGLPGRHNCHDDSSVQLRAVKGLYYTSYSGRCDDGFWYSRYAPSCS